jgi:hypothetical protein
MRADTSPKRARSREIGTTILKAAGGSQEIDGRTRPAKRFRAVQAAILSDLGGIENVTEVRLQLVNRFASLAVWLEGQDKLALAGKRIDVERYARVAGNLRRLADAIGLDRVAREVEPLDGYLKRTA